ncbi:ComF family protein [Streptomyces clavuligerus]|nr:ComF family protein [Streptomyces clavuligerus]ANW19946.1 phosphoribosyltransferase [Streptomyces clavuligerus]AXU14570.1 ComF family protein [Streptomyces clavuligerus]MBY6304581.1 ComF family protein [Streptomyces clavuligerus]QCS07343.1 ComF family protein [Streptomyces clavuligerus]QPJ93309.1 ComF family protein [Streptomyces clavuligerus]
MRGWWQEIRGLVLPTACAGCGTPGPVLCVTCGRTLEEGAARRVRPAPEPPGLPVVYACAAYTDAVRAVLIAHKERGALGLAGPLGAVLARAVRAALARDGAGAGPVFLVPVPSSRRAVRARGHDAGRRVALAAAGELRRAGERVRVLPVLRQCREVADQATLTAAERPANLGGALAAVPGAGRFLTGARTVLVDDLMTSGASLTEAARALRAAGAEGVSLSGRGVAAVVAVPPMSLP